jgi:hypothetical protein
MVTDYDWQLLDERLKSIEDSIQLLQILFPQIKPPESLDDYVLKEGDLMQPGYVQQWRNKDEV